MEGGASEHREAWSGTPQDTTSSLGEDSWLAGDRLLGHAVPISFPHPANRGHNSRAICPDWACKGLSRDCLLWPQGMEGVVLTAF